MATKIYHNPRCRKSRETLQILEDRKEDVEIVEYLKTPPTAGELKDILGLLGISAVQLLRKGEAIFKENYKGKDFSEEEWIQIMVDNPKLIERPIVVKNSKAALGRPPENIMEIL
jgi:arsenate reductase